MVFVWEFNALVAVISFVLSMVLGVGGGLEVEGGRPVRVVLSTRPVIDRGLLVDAAMARTINGVLVDLDRRRVGAFLRCADSRRAAPAIPVEREALCYAHLVGATTSRAFRIVAGDEVGAAVAVAMDDPGAPPIAIDRGRLVALYDDDRPYAGPLEWTVDLAPRGRSFELARPYVASATRMDRTTMKRRLYRGINVMVDDADRDLAASTMHVRLPPDYDPRQPAGLVVWASPSPDGRIPGVLDAGLDELGFVAIGMDDAGNDRDVPDKFQLAFDAVSTASSKFHVDRERVYIAGLSGGGKVSSILCICFPEIFAGAIPIVGLGTHATLDASFGDHRQPYYARPARRTLDLARQRPIAAISGPPDYNHPEIAERAARLVAEGFARVHYFEHSDMGHTMPTPERFTEALRYVDEPHSTARDAAVKSAVATLAAYEANRDDALPLDDGDREALVGITRTAPWSKPAWRALELLRR